MVLYGCNIEDDRNYMIQYALTLAQLLVFNCSQNPKNVFETRHRSDREPPLPLFLGSYVHIKTRSKDLVDILHRMGLSVSYDRVMAMSSDLANTTINQYESVGAVCPPSLNVGVFTTSAVDNIDHDPSSTSAHGSFHGTGISLLTSYL